MKRRTHFLYHDFGPVKIFLDDLHKIVDTLPKNADAQNIEIETSEFELANIDELVELKQERIQEINIRCTVNEPSWAYISIKVDEKHGVLMCSKNTPQLTSAFYEVEKILLQLRKRSEWTEHLLPIVASFGSAGTILLLQGQVSKNPILTTIGIIISVTLAVFLLLYLATKSIRRSEILLVYRDEVRSFWRRNQDTIIVAVITSILSIIATLIIQALTQ